MAQVHLPSSLEEVRITNLPDTAYYIPHFISTDEEQELLDQINSRPLRDWKILSKRRLQAWPATLSNNMLVAAQLPSWLVHPVIPRLSSIPVLAPTTTVTVADCTTPTPENPRTDIFARSPHGAPNHVLINEYKPGIGIMPHTDGPAYYPLVATVSLGAPIVLDIHERAVDGGLVRVPQYRILQEPGSLLITLGKLYSDYFHGIADVDEDGNLGPETIANWEYLGDRAQYLGGECKRATRISLTFRDVPHVVKPSRLFPGLVAKGR